MTKRTTSAANATAGSFTRPEAGTATGTGATGPGTDRYRQRHERELSSDHFRAGPDGLTVSSIGFGTYLGADADGDDDAYVNAARVALRSGINVLDTAINYRCQRSERAVGRVLQLMLADGEISRDEIVVCTKAGYVPLEDFPPSTREGYQGYLRREFYARRVMTPESVVAGGHCLAPGFLADCIHRSRRNLGIDRLDVLYLHNPEQQLGSIDRGTLRDRIREAFSLLEDRVAAGDVGVYGISTWQGLRVPPGARDHLALADLVQVAREVGGDGHHFRVVQMPVSLAMPEAVRVATQEAREGSLLPAIACARALGLSVVASAPLMQGKLTQQLPDALRTMYPARLTTDAQRALAFVRSVPGIATTLVGMKQAAHVTENLGAAR